jgi:hypothetical protein
MSLHLTARGVYRISEVDGFGREIKRSALAPNLILNCGLNDLLNHYWADQFAYCVLGTGSTPTTVAGGAATISQNNLTVTLVPNGESIQFTAGDVGNTLKWNAGGQVVLIVAYLTPTTVTVNASANLPAAAFTLYRTNQTDLVTEAVRTNTYVTDLNACGTTVTPPGTLTMWRTFDFPLEVASTTYRELGVSPLVTAGGNLFARMVFSSPFTVNANNKARVTYLLTVTLTPTSPSSRSALIGGWPLAPATTTSGYEAIEHWAISSVYVDGTTVPCCSVDGVPILTNEPLSTNSCLLSSDTQALITPAAAPLNRWAAGAFSIPTATSNYVENSFTVLREARIPTGLGAMNNIRVMSVGKRTSPTNFLPVHTFLFDEAQIKQPEYDLQLAFRLSWGRSL